MGHAKEQMLFIKISEHMQLPIKQFRVRCSAIGQIMSEPRGKSVAQKIADLRAQLDKKNETLAKTKPELKTYAKTVQAIENLQQKINELLPFENEPNLSDSCKTYLYKWVNEQVYFKQFHFESKQTTKGIMVEDSAISYASLHIPEMEFSYKNDEYFDNDEWMHGTPDVITDEYIFDNKSSYTHDTFPLYESELPESDYDWQVLGYMYLTNKPKGGVVYTLMSMPDTMIRTEARRKLGPDYTLEEYEEFAAHFMYDDFPPYLRLKRFDVQRDEEKIEAIKARVEQCREFIKNKIIPMIEQNAKTFEV